jgi:hypothetical protein
MKNLLFWLLFIVVGVVFIGISSKSAAAHVDMKDPGIGLSALHQQAEQTPVPVVPSPQGAVDTQESRELPPVGSNAGLVIGASVLVLIIIGGVLGSRRREKH